MIGRPDIDAGCYNDARACKEQYKALIAAIKASVSAAQLLVLNVRHRWAPLCELLGVSISDAPCTTRNSVAAMPALIDPEEAE